MALRLEGKQQADLERRIDRLENTLKAVAEETGSVSVHGPCQSCGQCLVLRRRGEVYCPQCGEGQSL